MSQIITDRVRTSRRALLKEIGLSEEQVAAFSGQSLAQQG